jgi:hypothetical protein
MVGKSGFIDSESRCVEKCFIVKDIINSEGEFVVDK